MYTILQCMYDSQHAYTILNNIRNMLAQLRSEPIRSEQTCKNHTLTESLCV